MAQWKYHRDGAAGLKYRSSLYWIARTDKIPAVYSPQERSEVNVQARRVSLLHMAMMEIL